MAIWRWCGYVWIRSFIPPFPHINKPIDMDKHGDGPQSTLVTIIIQAPSFVKLFKDTGSMQAHAQVPQISPQVGLSLQLYMASKCQHNLPYLFTHRRHYTAALFCESECQCWCQFWCMGVSWQCYQPLAESFKSFLFPASMHILAATKDHIWATG